MKENWQPIDTAPMDGSEFLALGPDSEGGMFVFISAFLPTHTVGSGFGSVHSCCGYYEDRKPSHWMPLPRAMVDNPET